MVKTLILLPARHIFRFIQNLFWAGLRLFGLSLLIWYPLHWVTGDRFWPVQLVTYLMPWLLVGLVPALLTAWLARRNLLALTLALPTLLIGLTFAPLFLPRSPLALADDNDTTYTVMSYNIWARNQDVSAMAMVIGGVQPDILLLQEVRSPVAQRLSTELAEYYPNDKKLYLAYEASLGQAVISRYPLRSGAADTRQGRIQKLVADTLAGPVAVWNVHASQPLPWDRQYHQIKGLAEDFTTVDLPLIVGGDFNTTDQSETYQLINQQLGNAHWDTGWGFGFSFPAHAPRFKGLPLLTPLVRIDHIFYSSHFTAYNARTLSRSGGSDHLPVVTELVLNGQDRSWAAGTP